MKAFFKKFSLVTLLLLVTALVVVFLSRHAAAQQFGAYQYNQGYATPLFPSQTLAHQYADGILAGVNPETNSVFSTYTFPTNIYSIPPFVTANAGATNCQVAIYSVTTSNVVFETSAVNVLIYFQIIGH